MLTLPSNVSTARDQKRSAFSQFVSPTAQRNLWDRILHLAEVAKVDHAQVVVKDEIHKRCISK